MSALYTRLLVMAAQGEHVPAGLLAALERGDAPPVALPHRDITREEYAGVLWASLAMSTLPMDELLGIACAHEARDGYDLDDTRIPRVASYARHAASLPRLREALGHDDDALRWVCACASYLHHQGVTPAMLDGADRGPPAGVQLRTIAAWLESPARTVWWARGAEARLPDVARRLRSAADRLEKSHAALTEQRC